MRKNRSWFGVAVAATFLCLGACTTTQAADEARKLQKGEIPGKIMAAINDRFPGADVTSAEKENEDGKIVYDIELKHEGRKYEMDIHDDGTIVEIEKQIKDAPAAVTKAVRTKYPGATVKEVMEVNKVDGKKETPDHYEVVIATDGGKEKEVIVALDGSSAREEAEEKKDEKEKK
jgi:uncharacterized membrane protein YkoI